MKRTPDGSKKSFSLKYIDWDNVYNNVFHVIEEFTVERERRAGQYQTGYSFICKWHTVWSCRMQEGLHDMGQGIEQMLRNQGKDYAPHLFKYSQILMATNKMKPSMQLAVLQKDFGPYGRKNTRIGSI